MRAFVWVDGKGTSMFAHQQENQGLVGLGAVAVVIALWLLGAAVLLKAYQAGAGEAVPAGAMCQLVCSTRGAGG